MGNQCSKVTTWSLVRVRQEQYIYYFGIPVDWKSIVNNPKEFIKKLEIFLNGIDK